MIAPRVKDVASLLLSEKANSLAHGSIAARGSIWTNSLLVLSALLGYIAGFSGLASLVSKTWVSVIALAAGLSTTALILRLTMSNADAHRQAKAKYELLYLKTVGCDISTDEGAAHFDTMWEAFIEVVNEVNRGPAALTPHQIDKFEMKGREALRDVLPSEAARHEAHLLLPD